MEGVRSVMRSLSPPRPISWAGIGWSAVGLGVALLAYTLALKAPEVRLLLLGIPVALIGTFSLRGRAGEWTSLASVLVFLAVILSSVWSAAASDGSLVGGLLPWSDASLFGRNLQITLAVLAFLIGVAVCLSAAPVARSDGAVAGALMAFLLLAFARLFVGTTLTDGLGLATGVLAYRRPVDRSEKKTPLAYPAGYLLCGDRAGGTGWGVLRAPWIDS